MVHCRLSGILALPGLDASFGGVRWWFVGLMAVIGDFVVPDITIEDLLANFLNPSFALVIQESRPEQLLHLLALDILGVAHR